MTLDELLDRLREASAAAREIGLVEEAERSEEVLRRASERIGFGGSAYVLALAGGTGVGKSSMLNALAGHTVSAVRAIRPTTDDPIAWVADARRDEVAPLLAWLGIRHVTTHADDELASVVILDLPDVDSIRTEHRATVDALLPRIDAVAWVLDPEKYDDARLHGYLRDMAPHADRMRFILNKVDRLSATQQDELVADLRRRLAMSGIGEARVDAVSATSGSGIDQFRTELAREADAKALVIAKLETDAIESRTRLARAVGMDPAAPYAPLLPDDRRASATGAAVEAALSLIDPPGLARQVQHAVLNRARRSGGSPLGRVVALLDRLGGKGRRRADPAAYLRDWRRRGSLGRVLNPIHAALVEAAAAVPPASRPAVGAALAADTLEADLTGALDAATRAAAADLRIPGSILWPVMGAVQLVIGAVFVFTIAWYVTLFVSGGQVPVARWEAPILGPLPLPLVLLVGSVAASALLGLLLAIHAGWIGRRVGRRVAARVADAIGASVSVAGFGGLDRVEHARRAIGAMT